MTHWLTVVSFLALLITGGELIISHPRFYWGETGNSGTTPLFRISIPSSRDTVPSGYNYVMPDQNGWSRYLHFEAAWVLVLTGLVYVTASLVNAHFRKDLIPACAIGIGTPSAVSSENISVAHRPTRQNAHAYNVVQRISYLAVIFVLFPLSSGLDSLFLRPSTPRSRNRQPARRPAIRTHSPFLRLRVFS